MISVHAYPFWVFSDLTYHLKDTEIGVFLVALCCLIVEIQNLEVTAKRLLHQQVKILR